MSLGCFAGFLPTASSSARHSSSSSSSSRQPVVALAGGRRPSASRSPHCSCRCCHRRPSLARSPQRCCSRHRCRLVARQVQRCCKLHRQHCEAGKMLWPSQSHRRCQRKQLASSCGVLSHTEVPAAAAGVAGWQPRISTSRGQRDSVSSSTARHERHRACPGSGGSQVHVLAPGCSLQVMIWSVPLDV